MCVVQSGREKGWAGRRLYHLFVFPLLPHQEAQLPTVGVRLSQLWLFLLDRSLFSFESWADFCILVYERRGLSGKCAQFGGILVVGVPVFAFFLCRRENCSDSFGKHGIP